MHMLRQPPQTHAGGEDLELPLHTNSVEAVSLEDRVQRIWDTCAKRNISVQVVEQPLTRFIIAQRQLNGYRPHAYCDHFTTEWTTQDEEQLLRDGLLRELNPSAQHGQTVRGFSATEKQRTRRRAITHTPDFNLQNPAPHTILDHNSPENARELFTFKFATTVDFRAYYHQFGLDKQGQFVINGASGRSYHLTTIPTGATLSVDLASSYTDCLKAILLRCAPFRLLVHTYNDNVRIAADTSEELRQTIHLLFGLCQDLAISVNESLTDVLHSDFIEHTFLGVVFNMTNRSTTIAEKSAQRLRALTHNGILKVEHSTTIRHILQIFGLVNFAVCHLHTNRARWYHLLKFLRRRTGRHLDGAANLWAHLTTALPLWIAEILNAPPYVYPQDNAGETLTFSDACPDGLGGVLVHPSGDFNIIARPTTEAEKRLPINTLETIAARWVLEHVPQGTSPIKMFIDNTSAIALTKGRVPRGFTAAKIAED